MKLNKYWFKPKRYGYGAYPVTWEGWVIVLLTVAIVMFLAHVIFPEDTLSFIVSILILAAVLWYISEKKTKEKWGWRWGSSK